MEPLEPAYRNLFVTAIYPDNGDKNKYHITINGCIKIPDVFEYIQKREAYPDMRPVIKSPVPNAGNLCFVEFKSEFAKYVYGQIALAKSIGFAKYNQKFKGRTYPNPQFVNMNTVRIEPKSEFGKLGCQAMSDILISGVLQIGKLFLSSWGKKEGTLRYPCLALDGAGNVAGIKIGDGKASRFSLETSPLKNEIISVIRKITAGSSLPSNPTPLGVPAGHEGVKGALGPQTCPADGIFRQINSIPTPKAQLPPPVTACKPSAPAVHEPAPCADAKCDSALTELSQKIAYAMRNDILKRELCSKQEYKEESLPMILEYLSNAGIDGVVHMHQIYETAMNAILDKFYKRKINATRGGAQ